MIIVAWVSFSKGCCEAPVRTAQSKTDQKSNVFDEVDDETPTTINDKLNRKSSSPYYVTIQVLLFSNAAPSATELGNKEDKEELWQN
jgi:hypothetical protein